MTGLKQVPGHLLAFYQWWLDGLLLLLPITVRETICPAPDRLSLIVSGNRMECRLRHGRGDTVLMEHTFDLSESSIDTVVRSRLERLNGDGLHVTVLIPSRQVVRKNLSLPLNAEGSLREILKFEMDRQTPFTADQVWFNYRVLDRDAEQGKLRMQMAVCPLSFLQPLLERIQGWGIRPHVLGPDTGMNLLPPARRPAPAPLFHPQTRRLAGIAAVLLLALLYLPALRYETIADKLEGKLAELRTGTIQAQQLAQEKAAILDRVYFLQEQQNGSIPAIELLGEFTRLLPDHTWISRFAVGDGEIHLQGESAAAAALIPLLESSKYLEDVQFRSPVIRNNVSRLDRFHLSARIVHRGIIHGAG